MRKLWPKLIKDSVISFLLPSFLFFMFIFFPFSFISWRLITLQYSSGFCHTLTWISHGFTCVPHPDPPSSLPPHPIPLGHPSAPAPSTCLMHPTWTGNPLSFASFLPSFFPLSLPSSLPPLFSPSFSVCLFYQGTRFPDSKGSLSDSNRIWSVTGI